MATSDTEIANLALGHLGSATEITNLSTQKSPEAIAMRRWYETVRRSTLRAFHWPFATKIAALALIEQDPNDEWAYSYRQPSDCLMDRKIQSGVRNDTAQSRIPYKVSKDASGLLIFADKEDAVLEYTIDVTTVELYPDDFVIAFSLRLAMYASPKICGDDPAKFGQRAGQLYLLEIAAARNNAFNEEQSEEDPESELVRSRN